MKLKEGFTLIELLVVIAVIGLLASIVLVAVNNARLKARNTRRVADIKQIATALELYLDDNGNYPVDDNSGFESWADDSLDGSFISGLEPNYITEVPIDPINVSGNNFYYIYASPHGGCEGYCLGFNVEPNGLGYDCPDFAPGEWPDPPPSVRSFCAIRIRYQ